MLSMAAAGEPLVHGYLTTQDLDLMIAELRALPGDRLLDLGCGIGGVALEVHRRTGAEVIGIDISGRAVAAARARARELGMHEGVTFVRGSLATPPLVGASRAVAIDSLMFVPDLVGALRGIGRALGPGGRLFATTLITGPGGERRLRRSIHDAGGVIERLDNVTPALAERSRGRARAASSAGNGEPGSISGWLASRLIRVEEATVRLLIAGGRIARWRFVVRYPSPDDHREL